VRARRTGVVIGLVVVALLGVLVSVQPFTGDQALFASGARQLAHGDVLYRDVWDVKQPGIYLFYLVGHAVVGDGETALHLFELAVLLAFGVLLVVTLRNEFVRPWVVATVPVLVLGTYYATAEPVQLGQVESLVGIPLFLTLWCADRGSRLRAHRAWLVAAGLAGGVALVAKLVLAPIVVAAFVPVLLAWWGAAPGDRRRRITSDAAAMLLGLAVPLLATGAYLGVHGQLGTARWTYFEVTPRTTAIAGRPWSRLVDGGARTAARWALPLALALIGGFATRRRRWTPFEVGLVAWVVAATPVFLVQHWWIYQYPMFLVPIGVFAAHGVDALAGAIGRRPRHLAVAGAIAVLLAVPLALRVAANAGDVVRHGGAFTVDDRRALHLDVEPNYDDALAWSRHLADVGPTPHGIYVLGNPLDLYLSARRSSVAVNGWSPEQYPASVWQRLRNELRAARPDQIVVDRFSAAIMRERSPATLRFIRTHYVETGRSGDERWYVRRDP
jgi:hypothetical protein